MKNSMYCAVMIVLAIGFGLQAEQRSTSAGGAASKLTVVPSSKKDIDQMLVLVSLAAPMSPRTVRSLTDQVDEWRNLVLKSPPPEQRSSVRKTIDWYQKMVERIHAGEISNLRAFNQAVQDIQKTLGANEIFAKSFQVARSHMEAVLADSRVYNASPKQQLDLMPAVLYDVIQRLQGEQRQLRKRVREESEDKKELSEKDREELQPLKKRKIVLKHGDKKVVLSVASSFASKK